MKIISFISVFHILVGFVMKIGVTYSKMEFLRKDIYKSEKFGRNSQSIPRNKENFRYFIPTFNFSEKFVPPNRTYEFLELYKEISAIKNVSNNSFKNVYVNQVLIPMTDARVAKLKAETSYIETKNAERKKKMNLVKEDLEKNTSFAFIVGNLLNSSSQINSTQILDNIYNETFYYLNNKNLTNSTEGVTLGYF